MAKHIDKDLTDIFDEFNARMSDQFDKIEARIEKLKAALRGEKVED